MTPPDETTRRLRQELELALHYRRVRLYSEQILAGMEIAAADEWLRDQIRLDAESLTRQLPGIQQQILDACWGRPAGPPTGADKRVVR